MTTARVAKIPIRNWVENVAPSCLRRDLAVVATKPSTLYLFLNILTSAL